MEIKEEDAEGREKQEEKNRKEEKEGEAEPATRWTYRSMVPVYGYYTSGWFAYFDVSYGRLKINGFHILEKSQGKQKKKSNMLNSEGQNVNSRL